MWPIIRKELKAYFDHPTAYILLVVFLVVNSFFFFRAAFIQGVASLRAMFDFLPWILLFFVPAVTMRLVAEERKSGTIDLMLIQPFKLWQVLIGKVIAATIFLSIGLAVTLIIPITLAGFGSFDWGQVVAQYISAVFLIIGLSSIGVLSSTLSKNQVVSFIVALGLSFFFIISGLEVVVLGLAGVIRTIFEQFSLLTHYQNMTRGVIDVRDVIYFISFAASFLSVTYLLLERTRANRRRREFRQLKMGVVIIVAISVVINLVGASIPGRLDLTRNQIYTLAPATGELLSQLNDIVTVKLFASKALPPQISLTQRDVTDILRDFERKSGNNVRVEYITVEEEGEAAQEARSLGITPVQFNILKSQEFTLQQGYFGLSVLYADDRETIPFIDDTSDLEYQLASFIRKLTVDDKKKIGFLTGHGEKGIFRDLATFRQELNKQYLTEEINLVDPVESDETSDNGAGTSVKDVPSDIDTLVIAGSTQEVTSEEQIKIKDFINQDGTALFLIDAVSVNPQFLQATPNANSLADLVKEFGVTVNQDLVYDVRSNESVSFGGGLLTYILPYPFWARVPAAEGNPITGDVQSLVLPWASSLAVSNLPQNAESIEILKTTPFAALQTGSFNISPDQQFNVTQDQVAQRLMAVAVNLNSETQVDETNQSSLPAGRIVVVGDSDFLTEQFVRGGGGAPNLVFALNTVDWLMQDETLIGIRSKSRAPAPLIFESEGQPTMVRSLNLIGVPLLVVAYAAFRLWRRKKKTRQAYFAA